MILFNKKEVTIKKFPNGESIIDKTYALKNAFRKLDQFVLKYESDADFLQLLLLKKTLKRDSSLIIPYFPYSRMDRNSVDYGFTLKHICEFINFLNFKSVWIYEPHSDVTPALLNNVIIISVIPNLLKKTDFDPEKDFVLYPDAGAQKKYSEVVSAKKVLVGFKQRDFKTGKITGLQFARMEPRKDLGGQRVFIVDDLCSKGGTFILATKALKLMGVKEVNLVVAHCEETIYDGEILMTDLINHVYTTDSIIHNTFAGLDKMDRFPLDKL